MKLKDLAEARRLAYQLQELDETLGALSSAPATETMPVKVILSDAKKSRLSLHIDTHRLRSLLADERGWLAGRLRLLGVETDE